MFMMDRLEEILKEKKMSKRKVERDAGLGVGTIAKWKKINPNNQNLQKVADVLGVSVAYLIGESDFRSEQDALIAKWNDQMSADLPDDVRKIEAGIRIPVLGDVPCGIPTEAIEYLDAEDWEEISERMSRQGKFYALKVKGNSMSPRIQKGDILIIQFDRQPESGDVVIAKVDSENACCKRLIIHDDGIVLQSFNPCYDPIYYNSTQIKDIPVQIVGVVVEVRAKLK